MTEQNRDDDREEFEIEITDLDSQEKRHAMSAFWHYGTSHRLQMRLWMTLFILAGVALFTGAVLSPFLLQVAPRATTAPESTTLPLAQQSALCRQAGSAWVLDGSHPEPDSGLPVIATAPGEGSIDWWQGQLAPPTALQGRCLPLIIVHTLSPGENMIVWSAGR